MRRWLVVPFLCTLLVAAAPEGANRITSPQAWERTTHKQTQLERDPRFFYATLFPDGAAVARLQAKLPKTGKAFEASKEASATLARIFVAMAWGGLQFCLKENDKTHLGDWAWPLATALGHGQRVAFQVHGLTGAGSLYNLLVHGRSDRTEGDDHGRSAASHGFKFVVKKNKPLEMEEEKRGAVASVGALNRGQHHGINLAFGGLGNVRLDGDWIGPSGFAVTRKDKLDSGRQHGHLYLHSDFKDGLAGLLVGIEPSAFRTTSMYGGTHGVSSGTKDSTTEAALCGGEKMQKLLGKGGPAQYGGMWVILPSARDFQELERVIGVVDHLPEQERKDLFWGLLGANAREAKALLLAAVPPATRPRR